MLHTTHAMGESKSSSRNKKPASSQRHTHECMHSYYNCTYSVRQQECTCMQARTARRLYVRAQLLTPTRTGSLDGTVAKVMSKDSLSTRQTWSLPATVLHVDTRHYHAPGLGTSQLQHIPPHSHPYFSCVWRVFSCCLLRQACIVQVRLAGSTVPGQDSSQPKCPSIFIIKRSSRYSCWASITCKCTWSVSTQASVSTGPITSGPCCQHCGGNSLSSTWGSTIHGVKRCFSIWTAT